MRITSLKIRNFRGFEQMAIELPKLPAVVFAGVNGAGKTTILDCVAVLLSRLVNRIRSTTGGRTFAIDDIKIGSHYTDNEISIETTRTQASWRIIRTRPGRSAGSSNLHELTALASEFRARLSEDTGAGLPVFVYYPVNRAVLDIPLRIRKRHTFDPLSAYDDSLTGAQNSFRLFFEWFREREDYENELRLEAPNHRDFQLTAVRSAVESLLVGFSSLRIRRAPLRMVVTKGDMEITVNNLSDGEKCLLALVGDLARRLAIANPESPHPLSEPGIVLIDEIELHLHPDWQRKVIPALTATFSGCQFVVSTHSPAVLGHVDPGGVFLLRTSEHNPVISGISTYGHDTNRILEELFGVPARPVEFQRRLKSMFDALDRGQLDKVREDLATLNRDLGPDEPQLAKAGAMLRRKELIGK